MPVQRHFVPILLNGLFFDDMMQKNEGSIMLNRIACIISSFFLEINIISEHEYEAYAYSLEIFLSTIINFLLVVFFSILS